MKIVLLAKQAVNDHRLKILKAQEKVGKIRVARIEFYCPLHKVWHGVGIHGIRNTIQFRGDKLREIALDYQANSTIFGCPITRRKEAIAKKKRDKNITVRDKKLIIKIPKKFVIHEERYQALVFGLVNRQSAQHREELLSRCNFALVKAARRYETTGNLEGGFGAYARVALKYVIMNYFSERAKFPTLEFDESWMQRSV